MQTASTLLHPSAGSFRDANAILIIPFTQVFSFRNFLSCSANIEEEKLHKK